MKEFIEKLIERLAENRRPIVTNDEDLEWNRAMYLCTGIVNQLAEEHKHCNKPSCEDCEVYDKEKHYCPKWCEVIKHTTSELAEEYNNDVCEWKQHEREIDVYFTECGQAHIFVDGNPEENNYEYCPYCGKKIEVVE